MGPGAVATGADAPGGDPVAVARDGVAEARRRMHDIVVVDTAGRVGVDADMMAQATAIRDAVRPDETLFVVDAMTGQDAVATAEAFRDGVGFTGVVLSKLDGDARGGAALSVRYVTGTPILFASTGEKLADFDVFHPERMASRILGMGDMLTLIEQAESAFDADEAQRMAETMASGGKFTLDDFLDQMMALKKMGPLSGILGMLPGMGQLKDQIADIDDRDLDHVAAIIRSMTPGERADPKMINGSRRNRIALGSGRSVFDVKKLIENFFESQKMMSQMAGSFGLGGARRSNRSRKGKKGRKGKAGARGRGPARMPGGLPGGFPGGMSGGMPGGGGPPPALPGTMPKLPPGTSLPDLSKLKFPKQ
ncbi:MAG: signal recognition particle protein, partial [Mycobacteriales bacterium]